MAIFRKEDNAASIAELLGPLLPPFQQLPLPDTPNCPPDPYPTPSPPPHSSLLSNPACQPHHRALKTPRPITRNSIPLAAPRSGCVAFLQHSESMAPKRGEQPP
eukprot:1144295-Pleurochrysis_carterae.AAC.1